MKTKLNILFSILLVACFFNCKNNKNTQTEEHSTTVTNQTAEKQGQAFIKDDGSKPNVLQIAMDSKDHTTLVAAVQAAGLENALVNAGPLMVFAPTNEAFAALPEGTVANLLKPENKARLVGLFFYQLCLWKQPDKISVLIYYFLQCPRRLLVVNRRPIRGS